MSSSPYIVPTCQQPIEILHQEATFLVVSKPSGLLSVPGRHPDNHDSLISRLQQDWPSAQIVHRLDMATSGVMVIALTPESHRQLSQQFQQRQTVKRYEAIVYGDLRDDEGSFNQPMRCDWPRRPLQMVDHVHGKAALTHYRVMERWEDLSRTRLELHPITGRSHQLRIHTFAVGHPILGCGFYAHPEALRMAPRLLLHATELTFLHPEHGATLTFRQAAPF